MKKIDKLEKINNTINELMQAVNSATTIEDVKKASKELRKMENERDELTQNSKGDVPDMKNYLSTNKAVTDFIDIVKASRQTNKSVNSIWNSETSTQWNKNLVTNGLTIDDTNNYLPRKIELAIQTQLTDHNAVFPLFKVTNIGAVLITNTLESDDEAQVHVTGSEKQEQQATLRVSNVNPVMVYKLQSVDEIVRRTTGLGSYAELFELLVREMTQAIINKIVDLALIEGTATGAGSSDDGFIPIMSESDTDKVSHVDGSVDFASAVESATDDVTYAGKKYLILTRDHKRALLASLRTNNPNVNYRNNNRDLADEFGLDGLVIYSGTKAISPIVLAQDTYHVDMSPLTRIEAFEWKTNENKLLIETATTGRTVQFGAASVIDLTAE